jgi:hypothetical protein
MDTADARDSLGDRLAISIGKSGIHALKHHDSRAVVATLIDIYGRALS